MLQGPDQFGYLHESKKTFPRWGVNQITFGRGRVIYYDEGGVEKFY